MRPWLGVGNGACDLGPGKRRVLARRLRALSLPSEACLSPPPVCFRLDRLTARAKRRPTRSFPRGLSVLLMVPLAAAIGGGDALREAVAPADDAPNSRITN